MLLPEKVDACNVNFLCYYKESTPKKCEMVVASQLHYIFLSLSLSLPCTQYAARNTSFHINNRLWSKKDLMTYVGINAGTAGVDLYQG